ncbi:MAG: hypothetical protein K2U26_05810 [Cyclobacteriaceae bacterium]|nr:hypothetical protein [Cyclobacteriaceae bacterium]
MEQNNFSERWKEEVLGSMRGMKRAEPNPFLFTRIEARIEKQWGRMGVWQVRLAAAVMVVLLIVNSVALLRSNRTAGETTDAYSISTIQHY